MSRLGGNQSSPNPGAPVPARVVQTFLPTDAIFDRMAQSAGALNIALQPANVQMTVLVRQMTQLIEATKAGIKPPPKPPEPKDDFTPLWQNFSQRVRSALGEMARGAVAVGIGVGVLDRAVGAVQSRISAFVGAFNPVEVTRFNLALKDTHAAIGQILVPVLERFRVLLRAVGDGFASLSPGGRALVAGLAAASAGMVVMTGATLALSAAVNSATFGISAAVGVMVGSLAGMAFALKDTAGLQDSFRKIVGQVVRVVNGLGEAIAPVVAAFMPVVDQAMELFALGAGVLASIIKEATPYVYILAQGLGVLAKWFVEVNRRILEMFGIQAQAFDLKNSEGLGVRQTSTTQLGSFLSKAQEQAFSIGKAEDPAKQTADLMKQVNEKIANMAKWIEGIYNIAVAWRDRAEQVKDRVSGVVSGVQNAAEQIKPMDILAPGPAMLHKLIMRSITG